VNGRQDRGGKIGRHSSHPPFILWYWAHVTRGEEQLEGETAVDHPEKQLEALIAHHYGLFVRKVVPCSEGWHLTTNRGTFLLSRAGKRDGTYWDMVSRLLRHLRRRGVRQLPRLELTAEGKPLFSGFHSRYLLWSGGQLKSLNWHSLNTWASVGRTLAHLHLASRDFTPRFTDGKYTVVGRWKMFWTQSYRMLETIGASCRLTGDPQSADREWRRVHTYAASMIETALRYFEAAGGDDAVQQHAKYGIVGQHDLTRRSWGGTLRGAVTLKTWDETVLDVRVRDIAHMLHLAYGTKTAFRDRVRVLLKHYQSVHPLSDAEWPLLYGRMLFPGPLVQTARDVYIRQTVSDSAAQKMLKRAASELERREYHLRCLPRLLKETVGVSVPEIDWLKSSSITVHHTGHT
jgi:Ser/Thr protein kinase RdoA (MazF antagonist)